MEIVQKARVFRLIMEKYLIGIIGILFLFSPDIASAETYLCTFKCVQQNGSDKMCQTSYQRTDDGFKSESNFDGVLRYPSFKEDETFINMLYHNTRAAFIQLVMINKIDLQFIQSSTSALDQWAYFVRGTCTVAESNN